MSPVISSPKTLHDLVKWNPSVNYTTVSVTITNASGIDFVLPVGMPLEINFANLTATPVSAGGEGDTNGILYSGGPLPLPANTTIKAPALVRGPACINANALPAADLGGSDLDEADIVAELTALHPPIVVLTEPEVSETQTT